MPNPFPGMDPYIERPAIWADFRASFVVYIQSALQPRLKPSYVAMIDARTFEEELPRCSWRDEVRETYVKIVNPMEIDRTIAAVVPLSPSNKVAGPGRESYLEMQEALTADETTVIEIDLLRDGDPTVIRDPGQLKCLPPFSYLVSTCRPSHRRRDVYPVMLRQRLPTINVRPRDGDPDIPLDLQTVVNRVWNDSGYPARLRYESKPPGKMSAEDVAWCEQLLAEKGFR